MNKLVVCVDDIRSNLDLMGLVVENMRRFDVVAVPTGQAALDAVAQRAPDLMIIDLRMPHMDGFALVAALRSLPTMRHCRLIAISAEVSEATQAMCLAAGFDHYVTKPFEVEAMQALIADLLDGANS